MNVVADEAKAVVALRATAAVAAAPITRTLAMPVRILFHSSLADVLGHMGSFRSCDSFPRRLVIARLVPRGAMTPEKGGP